MGKLAELGQRIKAVENIQAVTRILATVAAAKLSRTRRRAAGMRPYSRTVREMLWRQQEAITPTGAAILRLSPLLHPREAVKNVAVLVVTADRGMCGAYNLEACRRALEFWDRSRAAGRHVTFVLKGKRGIAYFRRRNAEIRHHESWRREGLTAPDVERLLGVLLDLYRSGDADAVYAVYTEFHSPIHRVSRVLRVLPVDVPGGARPAARPGEWHYEPDVGDVVDDLLTVYLRVELCDVLLESYASEQGARMITMQEATERADRALQECRVQHHRLRREAITLDLLQTLFASRAARATPAAPAPRV
jgi:F-type H+-transporting ATPase subunit gamma